MNERKPKPVATWTIHTDGAICPQRGISGLGAIARNPHGQICYWWHKRVGRLTCNEAEYAAAIFALEQMIQSNRVAEIDELVIYLGQFLLVHLSGEQHRVLFVLERHQLHTGLASAIPETRVQSPDLGLLFICYTEFLHKTFQ